MGLLSKAAVKTEPPAGTDASIRAFLEAYSRDHDSFHCVVLRADEQKVRDMAGLLGEVTALTNGATLVLLPCSLDRQLAAHRLSKSLNAALLCQLEADSPDTALAALGPFL